MSALPQKRTAITEDEYLTFERASAIKHEWIDGEIVAMTDASAAHNLICASTAFVLYAQLRHRACRLYVSDMRVKIQAIGLYTYPDISVVCGDSQFSDDQRDSLLNPTLIIEVLSPTTERYDRGREFQHYRTLASLREYVLIAQDSPRIERYLRQPDDSWQLIDAQGIDAGLTLASIDCTLHLAEVYEQITFTDDMA
jgi:Uma2 family endonuclease